MAYSRRPILPPVVKNSVLRQKINSVLPQNPIEFKTLAFPSMKRKDINENSHGYFSIVAMCVFTIMGETEKHEGKDYKCTCKSVGVYILLWLGFEARFCVDPGPPTFVCSTCDYRSSEKITSNGPQIPLLGSHVSYAAWPFWVYWLVGEHWHYSPRTFNRQFSNMLGFQSVIYITFSLTLAICIRKNNL